jgi:hypothetical protein
MSERSAVSRLGRATAWGRFARSARYVAGRSKHLYSRTLDICSHLWPASRTASARPWTRCSTGRLRPVRGMCAPGAAPVHRHRSPAWCRGSRPVSRLLCPGVARVAAIHLGPALPPASCGPPGDSAGSASTAASPRPVRPRFDLAPGGVYRADRSPGRWCALTAPFHPYRRPHRTVRTRRRAAAVCFLWHCPAGRPDWRLASTLPCGGRTFLGPGQPGPRPPGRLPLRCQYATRATDATS